jgi:hypothetical protein
MSPGGIPAVPAPAGLADPSGPEMFPTQAQASSAPAMFSQLGRIETFAKAW